VIKKIFFILVLFISQFPYAQLNELSLDSIRKNHQTKLDNKIFYLNKSLEYKDFVCVFPEGKYGIVNNSDFGKKRVVIPFIFSTYYYEQGIPYAKMDSLWYKVDRKSAKVYTLSSSKQNHIKEQYEKIEWSTNTSVYYDKKTKLENNGDYQLEGRKVYSKPILKQECNEEGAVVVKIEVAQSGKVIKAIPGMRGSTNPSQCLFESAKAAALNTKFNKDSNAPSKQIGKIVYRFSL